MKFTLCLTHRKQTASFSMAGSMLTIAPLWLMLAAANTSAYAQTPDNVPNASATTTPTPSPGDWTEFMRDNMQRWNPYETVLGVGNVGDLQLKWKNFPFSYEAGGNQTMSSPAVANGVVYFGSFDNNVYALNASTGEKLWTIATGFPIYSSPAVANGVVYVIPYGGYFGNNLYALNASTGAQLWTFATGGYVSSSPTVVNGVVYFCAPAWERGPQTVYALNASTGAELWTSPFAGSSPAVANGVVYIGSPDNNVYALNASTGAKMWNYTTGGGVDSSPAVANGIVYVGSGDGNVYALNASTGAKRWSYAGPEVYSSPAVANGVVYVNSEDGNVYALNAATGAKLWSYATGAGTSLTSSPAVANGVVYVASGIGSLYALNASTGAELWSYDIEELNSSPAIVDGVVYILGGEYAYAFSLGADLFLRIWPSTTTVHQGDLLTYAFPVWNLGPTNADYEVLNTEVPAGTVFDYIRISGTPGLGTCTHTPYLGAGPIPIVCHENSAMAPNTTWTVRLTVKVTAPAGTVITESAATSEDTFDPNLANNMATVSLKVQ